MRPGRFRASCDEILMAEIGPNASGGTENPLGKTETGTRKVTSRPTAPNQSVMAAPTRQRRRNLHGFRYNISERFSSIPAPRMHGLQMPPRVSAAPSRRGHLQSVLRDETLRHRLFRARHATRRDADGDRSDAFCGPPDRPLQFKASGTRARRTCGAVRRERGRSPWRVASEG